MPTRRTLLLSFLLLLPGGTFGQQTPGPVARAEALMQKLRSADPSVRGAAKLELMSSPSPDALPVLLKNASVAQGDQRTNLIEILGVYKDPRKISTLIQMSRPFQSEYVYGPIHNQLVELGGPAAQALMDSVPDECDGAEWEPAGYRSGGGRMLEEMGEPSFRARLSGLRSGKRCKQEAASESLLGVYMRPGRGPQLEPEEEIEREEVWALTQAAEHSDPKIKDTAYAWIDALLAANAPTTDYSKFVEALIATYQTDAPAETRAEIARLLAEVSSPRVRRFMRAAVHAPNPEVQKIATNYVAQHAPPAKARPAPAPRTSEQKIQVAEELGNSYESSNTPKLASLLGDADPKVRAAAAKALGELNVAATDPRDERDRDVEHALPPLLKALGDSSAEVRAAAAAAVGEIEQRNDANEQIDPDVSSRLAGLLKDPASPVIAAAARALGQIRDVSALPLLLPLVSHADHTVKFDAVFALSQMHDPAATCPLLSLLTDADREIQEIASRGLYDKFDSGERCPGDIETLLAASKNGLTQRIALEALAKLKDPRSVDPLIHEIQSFTARSACPECPVLAKIGDKRAVAPMVKLIQDRKGDVGPEVVYALGELKDATAAPAIIPLGKDARPAMRISVIKALVELNQCQSIASVRGALSDEIAEVRAAAADAAGSCKDLQSVDLLIRMLQTDLIPAAKALGDIGDKRAVDPLMACFKQKQLWGRRFVAHALGQLHDPKTVDLLIAGLHDDTKTSEPIEVGIASAWALGEIGDARAVPALQQVVREAPNWPSPKADAAAAALKKLGATVPAREGKP